MIEERIARLKARLDRTMAALDRERQRVEAMERALLALREFAAQEVRVRSDLRAWEARRLMLDLLDFVNRHALDGLCRGSWAGDLPGEERDPRPREVARA